MSVLNFIAVGSVLRISQVSLFSYNPYYWKYNEGDK